MDAERKQGLTPDQAIVGRSFTMLDADLLGPTYAACDQVASPKPKAERKQEKKRKPRRVAPLRGGGSSGGAGGDIVWTIRGPVTLGQNSKYPKFVGARNFTVIRLEAFFNTAPQAGTARFTLKRDGVVVGYVDVAGGATSGSRDVSPPADIPPGAALTIELSAPPAALTDFVSVTKPNLGVTATVIARVA